MRRFALTYLIVILLICGCSLFQSSAKNKATGIERLKMYDIPFTEESFFKYLLKDNDEVIKDFLDAGYSPNIMNEQKDPALIIACENGCKKVVLLLLRRGANPHITDLDGTTPLMYAAYNHQPEIVDILIRHNVNVNQQNKAGWTALMFAIEGGNGDCIDKVITKDTNLDLKNNQGETAKDIALKYDYKFVAKYLQDKVDYLNGRYDRGEKKTLIKLGNL